MIIQIDGVNKYAIKRFVIDGYDVSEQKWKERGCTWHVYEWSRRSGQKEVQWNHLGEYSYSASALAGVIQTTITNSSGCDRYGRIASILRQVHENPNFGHVPEIKEKKMSGSLIVKITWDNGNDSVTPKEVEEFLHEYSLIFGFKVEERVCDK